MSDEVARRRLHQELTDRAAEGLHDLGYDPKTNDWLCQCGQTFTSDGAGGHIFDCAVAELVRVGDLSAASAPTARRLIDEGFSGTVDDLLTVAHAVAA